MNGLLCILSMDDNCKLVHSVDGVQNAPSTSVLSISEFFSPFLFSSIAYIYMFIHLFSSQFMYISNRNGENSTYTKNRDRKIDCRNIELELNFPSIQDIIGKRIYVYVHVHILHSCCMLTHLLHPSIV